MIAELASSPRGRERGKSLGAARGATWLECANCGYGFSFDGLLADCPVCRRTAYAPWVDLVATSDARGDE